MYQIDLEAQSLVDGGIIMAEVRVENMLRSRHHNLTYVDAPMGVTQFIGGHFSFEMHKTFRILEHAY